MRSVLLEQEAAGRPFDTMALAIAGWVRFMVGVDHEGALIDGIKDPNGGVQLGTLAARVVEAPTHANVAPFLQVYFGDEVASRPAIVAAVADAIEAINREGTGAVLANYER